MVLSNDNVTDFFLLNAIVNGATLAAHALSAGALWIATKIDKKNRAKEAKAGRKYRKGDVQGTRVNNPHGPGHAWHHHVFVKYLEDGTEVWEDRGISTRMML
jgi:hypothetical protein